MLFHSSVFLLPYNPVLTFVFRTWHSRYLPHLSRIKKTAQRNQIKRLVSQSCEQLGQQKYGVADNLQKVD